MAPKDHEDKPRLICNPYPGGRSAAYDKWEEEFLDAAAGKGDEDASWAPDRHEDTGLTWPSA